MLDKQMIEDIRTRTQEFWDKQVWQDDFAERIAKKNQKEFGHSIASEIDSKTAEILMSKYDVYFEHGKDSLERSRSMGDVWIKHEGILHPINIKTGKVIVTKGVPKRGHPNMTAMVKLLEALLADEIDSYYLLIIKFIVDGARPVQPEVYFVDMLDYLEYVSFDAGPGQIMMNEKDFFEVIKQEDVRPSMSTQHKIEDLLIKYSEGVKRLFTNRNNTILDLEAKSEEYSGQPNHHIDQSKLRIHNRK